jgi:RNA 3'-phosphate cyclase
LIDVDGSEGEGGGQILRTAVALSALTGQEILVHGIRSNRANPGLQAQHLCAVNGVAKMCNARVKGASMGSSELEFSPGKVSGGRHRLDVGTAGSITLVLQACMLASARSSGESRFEASGGTNVRWSPPIDFYGRALFPYLQRMGARARLLEMERGFYPEGGGRVVASWCPPSSYDPFSILERGRLKGVSGCVFVQGLAQHIGMRMGEVVRKSFLDTQVRLENEIAQGASKGAGLFLVADYETCWLCGDSLGERGLPAEAVSERAVEMLKGEMRSSATLDVHSADQLLPYMCLGTSPCSFIVRQVTGHLSAQAKLVGKFLGAKVTFTDMDGAARVDVQPSRTYS